MNKPTRPLAVEAEVIGNPTMEACAEPNFDARNVKKKEGGEGQKAVLPLLPLRSLGER
jgi:hypothetical protein